MTAATSEQRFYDGTPGHEIGACSDCGQRCDAAIGNHFGICLDKLPIVRKHPDRNGCDVIRDYAMDHQFLSINDVRPLLISAGVPESKRGPAFTAACRKGWIERVGDEPSKSRATKGHHVYRYRSCVGRFAREVAEAR